MRVVIQRVQSASVTIENKETATIDQGLLILLGIEEADGLDDIEWLGRKLSNLRIFEDENGVMNRSIRDIRGEFLVVSQFTLHAGTRKGNRPSYIKAAKPSIAIPLYEKFILQLAFTSGLEVKTGVFGANMQVALVNDGPVTILMDTKNKE